MKTALFHLVFSCECSSYLFFSMWYQPVPLSIHLLLHYIVIPLHNCLFSFQTPSALQQDSTGYFSIYFFIINLLKYCEGFFWSLDITGGWVRSISYDRTSRYSILSALMMMFHSWHTNRFYKKYVICICNPSTGLWKAVWFLSSLLYFQVFAIFTVLLVILQSNIHNKH